MGTVSTRQFTVITGGTNGIGLELAKIFLKNNSDVLVVGDMNVDEARAELTAAGGGDVTALHIDLAEKGGVEKLYDAVRAADRAVDALALNAGVGVGGPFLETDIDAEVKMIKLNCISVVKLAKLLVPDMVARGQGKVLITSSIAATMPAPFEAVYGATKAFDLSFSEGLRDELRDTGVSVTAVQPGPTDTNFFHRAGLDDTKVGAGKKDDPAQVAQQAYDALMAGKDKVYAGSLKTRMQGMSTEILPETVKAAQHRKMAEPGSGIKES
jgi:short-subunit dehydrogenase